MKIGTIERAVLLAFGVGLLIFMVLSLPYSFLKPEPTDISQYLITNLQIDAVLLGFSATLIVYVMKRELALGLRSEWTLGTAMSVFWAYFFSIMFAFILIPNSKTMSPNYIFIPASFTLTGILTSMAFFYLGIFKIGEKKGKA